jgi:ATP adenylyltransferase
LFPLQYEIRLCPALQKKPTLPTPHFDPNVKSQEELPVQDYNGGRPDPFSPPYIPNLYIGDLKDIENGVEYPILVSAK